MIEGSKNAKFGSGQVSVFTSGHMNALIMENLDSLSEDSRRNLIRILRAEEVEIRAEIRRNQA